VRQLEKLQLKEKLTKAELISEDVYDFEEEQFFRTQLFTMLPNNFNDDIDDIIEFGYDIDSAVSMCIMTNLEIE
jgi:hypothetical protein